MFGPPVETTSDETDAPLPPPSDGTGTMASYYTPTSSERNAIVYFAAPSDEADGSEGTLADDSGATEGEAPRDDIFALW